MLFHKILRSAVSILVLNMIVINTAKQVLLRNIFFKKTFSPANASLSKIKFHENFLSKMKVNYGRKGESQLTCMFGKFFKQFISISILGYISHK